MMLEITSLVVRAHVLRDVASQVVEVPRPPPPAVHLADLAVVHVAGEAVVTPALDVEREQIHPAHRGIEQEVRHLCT